MTVRAISFPVLHISARQHWVVCGPFGVAGTVSAGTGPVLPVRNVIDSACSPQALRLVCTDVRDLRWADEVVCQVRRRRRVRCADRVLVNCSRPRPRWCINPLPLNTNMVGTPRDLSITWRVCVSMCDAAVSFIDGLTT